MILNFQLFTIFQPINVFSVSVIDNLHDIDEKLTKNFEKILMNQDIFIGSCHRLQMDEPKIEREISTMLEKLIDKLENK